MAEGTPGGAAARRVAWGDGRTAPRASIVVPRGHPELAVRVEEWDAAFPRSQAAHIHAVTYTLTASASTRRASDVSHEAADATGGAPCAWITLPARWRGAAPPRIASFVAGRHCAAVALARAAALADDRTGEADVASQPERPLPLDAPIPVAGSGAPTWPPGFVGSITHTADRAIAVVACDRQLRSIGVDCEQLLDTSSAADIVEHVVPELDALLAGAGLAEYGLRPTVVTLVFSAKESLYKALHPLVDEFFDFTDVVAERLDMTSHSLDLRLLRPLGAAPGASDAAGAYAAGTTFTARYALLPREIVTLVELPIVSSGAARDAAGDRGPAGERAGTPQHPITSRRSHAGS